MKQIVLATHNKNKVFEFQNIFKEFDIEFILPTSLGINSMPEETGTTFKENAKIKASFISKYTTLPVLADDSGLIIDALPDILGVHSSRFMEESPYEEKCLAIIDMMKNIKDRSAHFVCALCFINNGEVFNFEGTCFGTINDKLIGQKGFGYDPIFIPHGYKKTYAELSNEEKNLISHRGDAIKQFINFLKNTNF